MYKVFIVDDEKYVVKSLKARINWEEYGFEVIGYSFNSTEAYEMILKMKPDLVFTDIRMPGRSGLELIKDIKESGLSTLTIVISGYAEFAYAQKALNYGSFGYCLKPFDDAEIIDFLKKAKNLLENSQMSVETKIMDLIDENSLEANESLIRLFTNYGINLDEKNKLSVCVSKGKDKLELGNVKLILKIGYEKYAYFITVSDSMSTQNILDKISKYDLKHVGISSPVSNVSEIKEAIRQAEVFAYNKFTACNKIFASPDVLQFKNKEDTIRQLEKAISKNDIQAVIEILDGMAEIFADGDLDIRHAIIIYNNVMAFSFRLKDQHFEDYIYDFHRLSELFGSIRTMINYLKDVLSRKPDMNFQTTIVNNQSVRMILKYVNDNFTEDISVHNISKYFKINANYVSQLFKKEVGIVFTEYLARLRIDFACNLLKTTCMSIGEIAEKVGYNDYFYFSRVFKKIKGISPSTFRMK